MPTFLYPEKLGADLAGAVRQKVSRALVIAESHVRTPELAEGVLSEGLADLVSIVRGQIADPYLASKAAQDRPEDIRPCLSCNQMCWGRRSRDYWISCLVNPSAGREAEWGEERIEPAPHPQRVLVVGGGPAGLEAARMAAQRGHRVVLAEAAPRLGGAFRLAGMQPRRGQIIDLLDWYERQLAALRVDVRLETLVDAAWIADLAPGKVVLATGSLPDESGFQKALPAQPALPGAELGQVFTAEAVMAREARVGERVIVLDEAGGWRGCGTAWKLAEAGHRVTIVTPDPYVGRELTRTSADLPLRQKLRQLGVEWRLETAVAQWHGTHATLVDLNTGEQELLEADSLVLAASRQAANWLAEELSVHGMEFIAIGDCTAPRQAPWAFYDGRKAGQAL